MNFTGQAGWKARKPGSLEAGREFNRRRGDAVKRGGCVCVLNYRKWVVWQYKTDRKAAFFPAQSLATPWVLRVEWIRSFLSIFGQDLQD